MKKSILLIAIAFSCSYRSLAVSDEGRSRFSPVTSVYFAPFSLLHRALGPSLRGGVQQYFGKRVALLAEGSYYLPKSREYTNLKGYQLELAARYYVKYDDDPETFPWFSIGTGMLKQTFTEAGELQDPLDLGSSQPKEGDLTRTVRFAFVGAGAKFQPLGKHWFIDAGVQIGVRHRDVDVAGLTEAEDHYFHAHTGNDATRGTMATPESYVPHFTFLCRIGIDIHWFKR